MSESIGPLNRNIPPFGEISLNGAEITHYIDIIDLPKGEKREACSTHIGEGAASELLGEFMLTGCHFPESDQEQMIRTAFICPGRSMLKKCRLKLIQADADGNIITEGKII